MFFIDADNGMGSDKGDVDDGFAIAALLSAKIPVAALASVWGNTTVDRAHPNNQALAKLFNYQDPCLRGAASAKAGPTEASRFLVENSAPKRVLALGPLSNVAQALRDGASGIDEVVVVGSNYSSWGRWPPVWPYEFNLAKDKTATREVFASRTPLTFVPLDVACLMRVGREDLARLPGEKGEYFRRHCERWLQRKQKMGSSTFAAWDYVAAYYAINPAAFQIKQTKALMHPNGWIQFGKGVRPVKVVLAYDRGALWAAFVRLFAG